MNEYDVRYEDHGMESIHSKWIATHRKTRNYRDVYAALDLSFAAASAEAHRLNRVRQKVLSTLQRTPIASR